MDYVNFGSTGLKVSRLALGTMGFGSRSWRKWALDEQESRPILRRALELGITFFDTADMYSLGESEEILGRALKEFGARRDRVVIATKAFSPMSDDPNDRGLSRKHLSHSIDNSLKRLGTDYVDVFQMHRWDPITPVEETLIALNDIVRAGKALYIGASTMSAWQFAKLLYTADRLGVARPVSMQPYYNILYREEEREMLPLCESEGIGVIPWSPLARGRLTRDWDSSSARSETDAFGRTLYATTEEADRQVVERVSEIATKRGVPRAQVALAWVLQKKPVTAPIVGATKLHHLNDAVDALSLKLTMDEIQLLEERYVPHAVTGFK